MRKILTSLTLALALVVGGGTAAAVVATTSTPEVAEAAYSEGSGGACFGKLKQRFVSGGRRFTRIEMVSCTTGRPLGYSVVVSGWVY